MALQPEYPETVVHVEMCPSAGGTWETLPVGFREFLSADSVFELKFEK